jgi:hypothetical protein
MSEQKQDFKPKALKVLALDRFRRFDKPPSDGDYNLFKITVMSNGKIRLAVSCSDRTTYGMSIYPIQLGSLEIMIKDIKDALEKGDDIPEAHFKLEVERQNYNTKQMEKVAFKTGIKNKTPFIALKNQNQSHLFPFESFDIVDMKIGDKTISTEHNSVAFFLNYWERLFKTIDASFLSMDLDQIETVSFDDNKPDKGKENFDSKGTDIPF